MKLMLLAALTMVIQDAAPKQSPFDQPMGELSGEGGDTPLDRMSLNQMMRLSTLPEARIREFRCAAGVSLPGAGKRPAFALSEAQRKEFVDKVATAVAHDVEMDKNIALGLINSFPEEPASKEDRAEILRFSSEMETECAPLIAKVREGTYELAPLAQPSVVNATLATCYARYTLAADAAKDEEEAKGLRATAAKAEAQALSGKEGDALVAARKGLADQLAAERARPITPDGDDMMRLVMCLPAIDAAKMEQAGK